MSRSFAELEKDSRVSAAEVGKVLREYVKVGAAINAVVVLKLIDQAFPGVADRELMKATALVGAVDQTRHGHTNDATAYLQVAAYL